MKNRLRLLRALFAFAIVAMPFAVNSNASYASGFASIDPHYQTGCVGQQITWNVVFIGDHATFTFGDGARVTCQNSCYPIHTFSNPVAYGQQLKVYDSSNHLIAQDSSTVNINCLLPRKDRTLKSTDQ